MTTNEESGGGVLTGGGTDVVGNGNNGGGVIMENLIEKSLYDIGDPDLMDVWDTDLNAVSNRRERRTRKFMHAHAFAKHDDDASFRGGFSPFHFGSRLRETFILK